MKKVFWILNLLKIPIGFRYFLTRRLRMYIGVTNYKQYESFRIYPDYLKIFDAKVILKKSLCIIVKEKDWMLVLQSGLSWK